MPFLILADADISTVPAEFVKNWWMMVLAFGTVAVQIWLGKNKKREISGKVQTEPAVQHAEKAELVALTQTVNEMRAESEQRTKSMHHENTENIKAMRDENAALHRNAQVSGENRVMAITQDVNSKMDGVTSKVGELMKLITDALVDNAKQGAEIAGLQKDMFRHDAEVRAIQQNIADLIKSPSNKRSA